MARIQTAEITTLQCPHLFPFNEGKFLAVWALDGSNSNSQTRHVSKSTTNSWIRAMFCYATARKVLSLCEQSLLHLNKSDYKYITFCEITLQIFKYKCFCVTNYWVLTCLRGFIRDVDREEGAPGGSLDEDGGGRGGERRGERHRQQVMAAQHVSWMSKNSALLIL